MSNDDGLRKAGLKSTVPRLRILGVLEHSDVRHMSAEDLYRKLLETGEDVGIATVYRVLTQFEQAGLVVRHNFDAGRAVYELNDESPHEHLICSRCNNVIEFTDPGLAERMADVARQNGFDLQSHSLYLYGICSTCREP